MAYQDLKDDIDQLQKNAKNYVKAAGNYYRLVIFKILTKSASLFVKFALLAICLMMFILFSSIALSFYLGKVFDNYCYGFLTVSGIYLVIALILSMVKISIIEGGVLRKFSEIFFNE